MSNDPSQKSRRAAFRVLSQDYPSIPGRALFVAGAIQGSGVILDISSSGASIYRPTKTVPRGIVLDLYFLQSDTKRRMYAEAEVVRKTEDGFAVRFLHVERELESLILSASEEAERDD